MTCLACQCNDDSNGSTYEELQAHKQLQLQTNVSGRGKSNFRTHSSMQHTTHLNIYASSGWQDECMRNLIIFSGNNRHLEHTHNNNHEQDYNPPVLAPNSLTDTHSPTHSYDYSGAETTTACLRMWYTIFNLPADKPSQPTTSWAASQSASSFHMSIQHSVCHVPYGTAASYK